MSFRRKAFSAVLLASAAVLCGCSIEADKGPASGIGPGGELNGTVLIDGSSTVLPISQAVAQEFHKVHPKVDPQVGSSGTGGGFTKFAAGETDINDASRPIKDSEKEACAKNGIEPIEFKIAIDGLTVAVNNENDWCDRLTVEQLKKIWEPNSAVKTWKDVDPAWPNEPIRLYGADTESGTFDYFTDAICGKEGASRTDYVASANDNVLVRGVAGDKYSLGYFGYAYYVENRDKMKAIGIAPASQPDAAVFPTDENIEAGAYVPLSRPLFLYVSSKALMRPEVAAFLEYYLNEGQDLVEETGYIRLKEDVISESRQLLKAKRG